MIINGTPEDNNLLGTAENDTISGLGGNDTLSGGLGDDSIEGGNGDDVISFDAGTKIINGGEGSDLVQLDFSAQTEDFILTYDQSNGASLTEGGILDGTEMQGIERFDISSGSGKDIINIATATVGSVVAGGAGDDSITGGRGDDSLYGEAGNNTYFGARGNDQIIGADDNDAAVYSGLASDYEVVVGNGFATVAEKVPQTIFGETTELFTDSLSNVEFILFEDGEIVVETGEFKPFADFPQAEAPTLEQNPDLDLELDQLEVDAAVEDGIPVYKFLRTDTQTQFYTTEEKERNVVEDLPEYELEEVSFVGAPPPPEGEDITGISPVYRFFNNVTGVHLYTINETEKTFIEENLDNYVFEGTPYYGFETQEEGTIPLYRFYNQSLGAHFYTTSEEERNSLIESPDFEAEGGDGIAYYVEPAPEL